MMTVLTVLPMTAALTLLAYLEIQIQEKKSGSVCYAKLLFHFNPLSFYVVSDMVG